MLVSTYLFKKPLVFGGSRLLCLRLCRCGVGLFFQLGNHAFFTCFSKSFFRAVNKDCDDRDRAKKQYYAGHVFCSC